MNTRRTDIHRPSAPELDPQEYEFIAVFDLHPDAALDNRWARERRAEMHAQGYRHSGIYGLGKCDHCGQNIRYAALLMHESTHTYIYVGERCLDNRFEAMTKTQFREMRKAAANARKFQARKTRIAELLEEHPHLVWLTYLNNLEEPGTVYLTDEEKREEGIADLSLIINWDKTQHLSLLTKTGRQFTLLHDLSYKLHKYGELSDNQIDLVSQVLGQIEERYERHLEREATKENVPDVPEGRITFTGKIVSTKLQDTYYGTSLKMLIVSDDGWKVWGTVPRSMDDPEKDQEITLTATLTRSDRDRTFGFMKRPQIAADAPKDARRDDTPRTTRRGSHADCEHPSTPAARRACRARRS